MKRKMLISIALITIMLLNCILPIFQVSAATNVVITLNSKLYNGIKANLEEKGIPAVYNDAQRRLSISQSALDEVKELKLSNYEIKDLTGLENFKNLEKIDLSSNELDENSNLEVLSAYNLNYLDLSSNHISDVSKITNLDNIETLNLHNQKFNQVNIIDLDNIEISNTSYDLPQILSKAGLLKSEWLIEEKDASGLEIKWSNFNNTALNLIVGYNNDIKFYGINTLKIRINDATNSLNNSEINIFNITISADERGVVFKDRNLYNAVKEQLSEGQDVNEDLFKYTEECDLYDKAYDEPMVLVIDINDIINKITSLKLNNKQIKDLTGIEYFVGLKKELDVSENYIDTIDKMIELVENKDKEEKALQGRIKAQVAIIKKIFDEMKNYENTIITEEKNLEKLSAELSKLQSADSPNAEDIVAKQKEIDNVLLKIEDARSNFNDCKPVLMTRLEKLYNIYNKEYILTTILTTDLKNITQTEFNELTYERAKELFIAQLTRFGAIEPYLTPFEKQYIISKYNIPTQITTIETVEENGVNVEREVTKDIENPIKTYFDKLQQRIEDWNLSRFKTALYDFRSMEVKLTMVNYCFLERLYKGGTDCLAFEYLDNEKEDRELNYENYGLYDYQNNDVTISEFEELFNLEYLTCSGDVNFENSFDTIYAIAGKFANVTDNEINAYVVLPELNRLNISENLIENIDEISKLAELKELKASDNEIADVQNVDWSAMTKLRILDLSMNDLSDVRCLEVIESLKELYVARNLLSGYFDFCISSMENLRVLDFSNNQINDIEYLVNQLEFMARGNYFENISEYLNSGIIDIRLNGQQLSMQENIERTETLTKIDLPKIFRQAEEIDHSRTSFGINSLFGNVTSDGKQVLLDTRSAGTNQATVIITNGTNGFGIASGTMCTIIYNVMDQATVSSVTIISGKTEIKKGESLNLTAVVEGDNNQDTSVIWQVSGNTSSNTKITENGVLTVGNDETAQSITITAVSKVDNTKQGTIQLTISSSTQGTPVSSISQTITLGYNVSGDYILGVAPKTPVSNFKNILAENCRVIVVKESNGSSQEITEGYIATGMLVKLQDENGNQLSDGNGNLLVFEIVVKGDVNKDGFADSLDSNLIKAHRNEVTALEGASLRAADINDDNQVNQTDSKLLLYHRAEVNGYDLNFKN